MGFDQTGRYLLAISHNGRGLFDSATWKRVARNDAKAYPIQGIGIGIGPVEGERIKVAEIDYDTGVLELEWPTGGLNLRYQSGMITVSSAE
jgi:hypothetical protein